MNNIGTAGIPKGSFGDMRRSTYLKAISAFIVGLLFTRMGWKYSWPIWSCRCLLPCIYICIHMHTHVCTHISMYTHKHVYAYICKCISMYTYVHTLAHTCTHTYKHVYTCIHLYAHTSIYTHTHTNTHKHVYIGSHTYMHIHEYVYEKSYVQAYTHGMHKHTRRYIHMHWQFCVIRNEIATLEVTFWRYSVGWIRKNVEMVSAL